MYLKDSKYLTAGKLSMPKEDMTRGNRKKGCGIAFCSKGRPPPATAICAVLCFH